MTTAVAEAPAVLVATLSKRLDARLTKVRRTADYVCQLELALVTAYNAVAAGKPGVPKQLSELDDPKLTYVGIAEDNRGNTAVVWVHGECVDVLVTMTMGFGQVISFLLLGVCPVDTDIED